MKLIKITIYTILLSCFAQLQLFAQKEAMPDSLLYYLKKIRSARDTINIRGTFTWIFEGSVKTILNDTVKDQLYNLQGKVDEDTFIELLTYYFSRLQQINTPAANENAIYLGKQFIGAFKNSGSKSSNYWFLGMLRELRIPFRNSGKINEMIAYFSELDKKYEINHDSAAVSIVNNVLSGSYFRLGEIDKAKYYQLKSIEYLNDEQEDYNLYPTAMILGKAGKVNRTPF